MAQNLDLNINVNTDQAGKSVGSLKAQLREAQAEVVSLADKFGATSKEAIEAAKRAGELKDRIGDARAMTEAFNPDAKFKALTASLSGVAGGFAAVQGAMGLLGGESEDVQKMLLKVQSAMAISQGLQSVGEAVDSFKNLGAVIKSTTLFQQAYNFVLGQKVVVTKADVIATEAQTVATVQQGAATVTTTTAVTGATTAMKAFRIALIGSGIGILIVAIGLAVEAFSNYVGAAAKAEEAQKKLNKEISDGAKIALDAEQNFLDGQEKLDIARAKSKNASEQEIFEIEQKYRRLRAESHQRHYQEVYGKDAEAAKDSIAEINKINTEGQIAALENEAKLRKEAKEQKDKELQELQDSEKETMLVLLSERAAEEFKVNEHYERLLFLASKYNQDDLQIKEAHKIELNKISDKYLKKEQEDERAIAFQRIQDLITDIDYENSLLDNDFEADQQRLANKEAYIAEQKRIELSNLDLTEQQRLLIIAKYANLVRDLEKEIADSKKKQREEELKADQELQEAKYQIAQSGLGLLSSLAGENEKLANIIFAISKALEIGRIISTTAGAIAQVNANTFAIPAILPPALVNPAFVTAAVIGAKKIATLKLGAAASIATIAAASISKFKSGGGGGGDIQGGSAATAQAPIIPQLPTPQTTNISRQSINDLGNQAVRAYVIETDVTGNQQRMAAIKQRARFS